MVVTITLNGKKVEALVKPDTLLIDFVRDHGCYSVKRGCRRYRYSGIRSSKGGCRTYRRLYEGTLLENNVNQIRIYIGEKILSSMTKFVPQCYICFRVEKSVSFEGLSGNIRKIIR